MTIQSNPSVHPPSNHLNRPQIDLSQPPINSDELREDINRKKRFLSCIALIMQSQKKHKNSGKQDFSSKNFPDKMRQFSNMREKCV